MSVYDQADHVKRTIDSVLAQTDIEFELIIVDDGANSAVKKVLHNYQNDRHIRIISQQNQGLTKALVLACAKAKYDFIARIDAGDRMLENRLSTQAQLLLEQHNVGVVCSWVNVVTEEGYFLYAIKLNETSLKAAVSSPSLAQLRTPFHASVMFRKSIYEMAGGYRPEFYFAQDCDLWSRMALYGEFAVVPEYLTTGLFTQSGISGRYLDQQRQLTTLVAEANQLRLNQQDDLAVLEKAKSIKPDVERLASDERQGSAKTQFPTLYFLARCLSDNRSIYAREYWLKAISAKPYSVLSWCNLLLSLFYRSSHETNN